MPHIIVIADQATDDGKPPVVFRERVTVTDFESEHFAHQLVERLGWAVGDADEADRRQRRGVDRSRARRRLIDAAQRELTGNGREQREPAFSGRGAQPAS